MKILTYKRTHTGDPDNSGHFGISDCMGVVRSYEYDAVLGLAESGLGKVLKASHEKSHGLESDRKGCKIQVTAVWKK